MPEAPEREEDFFAFAMRRMLAEAVRGVNEGREETPGERLEGGAGMAKMESERGDTRLFCPNVRKCLKELKLRENTKNWMCAGC